MIPTQRALVLHGGALGDFVLVAHLLAAIRAANPALHVDILARSPLLPWAIKHGAAHAGWNWEQHGLHLLYGDDLDAGHPRWARWAGYDLAISFVGAAGDALHRNLGQLTGAKIVTLDPRPPPESGLAHIVDRWKTGLREAGLMVRDVVFWNPIVDSLESTRGRNNLRRLCQGQADRIALFHPGSGGRSKCRPIEQWLGAVRRCRSYGLGAVWMIGPDERERQGQPLIENLQRVAPVIYEESVERAAEWVMGADLFVGHDAGMTHLAAACGVPTAAVFTATDPRVWRPLGPHVAVLAYSR